MKLLKSHRSQPPALGRRKEHSDAVLIFVGRDRQLRVQLSRVALLLLVICFLTALSCKFPPEAWEQITNLGLRLLEGSAQ